MVHLSRAGAPAENLGCAASAVSLSTDWVAALVSEADQGGSDLNGDGDTLDDVVEVHRVTDGPGACSAPTWRNLGQAAESVDVSGSASPRGQILPRTLAVPSFGITESFSVYHLFGCGSNGTSISER